jgi:hypothetical protein
MSSQQNYCLRIKGIDKLKCFDFLVWKKPILFFSQTFSFISTLPVCLPGLLAVSLRLGGGVQGPADAASHDDQVCSPLQHRGPGTAVLLVLCVYFNLAKQYADPWHFGTDPDPYLWLMDPDSDPIFVTDLQLFKTPTKN